MASESEAGACVTGSDMCARSSWREAKDCWHVGHWPTIFLRLDGNGVESIPGAVYCACGWDSKCASAIVVQKMLLVCVCDEELFVRLVL